MQQCNSSDQLRGTSFGLVVWGGLLGANLAPQPGQGPGGCFPLMARAFEKIRLELVSSRLSALGTLRDNRRYELVAHFGEMLAFNRNKFVGSYLRFKATSWL